MVKENYKILINKKLPAQLGLKVNDITWFSSVEVDNTSSSSDLVNCLFQVVSLLMNSISDNWF